MQSIFWLIYLLNSATETIPRNLNTIGVILSAISVVLGIIGIALNIWQMKSDCKKSDHKKSEGSAE